MTPGPDTGCTPRTGDVLVVEVSTPELDDVVRLDDRYGREGTSRHERTVAAVSARPSPRSLSRQRRAGPGDGHDVRTRLPPPRRLTPIPSPARERAPAGARAGRRPIGTGSGRSPTSRRRRRRSASRQGRRPSGVITNETLRKGSPPRHRLAKGAAKAKSSGKAAATPAPGPRRSRVPGRQRANRGGLAEDRDEARESGVDGGRGDACARSKPKTKQLENDFYALERRELPRRASSGPPGTRRGRSSGRLAKELDDARAQLRRPRRGGAQVGGASGLAR